MATWKRILTTDDAVTDTNIGTSNLTATDTVRTFKLASGSSLFAVQDNSGDNILVLSALSSVFASSFCGSIAICEDAASNQGVINLHASGTGSSYVRLKASPSATGSYTLTFPTAGPGGTKILQSNSSGVLSWIDTPSGGGTPAGSDTSIQWNDGGTAFGGNTALTYNDTTGTLKHTEKSHFQRIEITQTLSSSSAGGFGIGARLLSKVGSGTILGGRVYYLNNGAWAGASSGGQASSTYMLAVGTDATSANEMLVEGVVKMASNTGFSSANAGAPLYLTTSGNVTSTAPTSGNIRLVGWVLNATDALIYFRPDNSWITP